VAGDDQTFAHVAEFEEDVNQFAAAEWIDSAEGFVQE